MARIVRCDQCRAEREGPPAPPPYEWPRLEWLTPDEDDSYTLHGAEFCGWLCLDEWVTARRLLESAGPGG
jgi:hypothetical protein